MFVNVTVRLGYMWEGTHAFCTETSLCWLYRSKTEVHKLEQCKWQKQFSATESTEGHAQVNKSVGNHTPLYRTAARTAQVFESVNVSNSQHATEWTICVGSQTCHILPQCMDEDSFCCYHMCICCTVCVLLFFFTLDAGLMARSHYSEGPATSHFDTDFSWFPCVYKQMPRWFPRFQVATTCFSCSPPDLNLLVTNFIFCVHVK